MIITTARFNKRPRSRPSASKAGFTLVELAVATSMSMFVAAAIFTSFIFMARSSVGLANYSQMNSESRVGLEIFGRDVRAAESIAVGFNPYGFTVGVPTPSGGVDNIRYTYRPNDASRPLVRIDPSGKERVIMTGISELAFRYYHLQGGPAVVPVEVKQIQLQLKMVRKTISLDNTEKVVSARYILRNKDVST